MLLVYRERLVIINDSDTFKSRHVCHKIAFEKKPASDWNDWQKNLELFTRGGGYL